MEELKKETKPSMKMTSLQWSFLPLFILGTFIFLVSLAIPFGPHSTTSMLLKTLPLEKDLKGESNEGFKSNWESFSFFKEKIVFDGLIIEEDDLLVRNFGPEALTLYKEIMTWQEGRQFKVLYSLNELRGVVTKKLMLLMVLLEDFQCLSLHFKNGWQKERLDAPSGQWGQAERELLALLILSKKMGFSTLCKIVSKVESPEDLVAVAALFQKYSQEKDLLPFLLRLKKGQLSSFVNYLKRFEEEAFGFLRQALSEGNQAFNFIIHRELALYEGWIRKYGAHPKMCQHLIQYWNFGKPIKMALMILGLYIMIFAFMRLFFPLFKVSVFILFFLASISSLVLFLGEDPVKFSQVTNLHLKISEKATTEVFNVNPNEEGDPSMNHLTFAFTGFFLVVQILLFLLCRLQIQKIAKQEIINSLKLKLLENEETFFDLGLYVGLSGTVLSLIFLALGWSDLGLMSAYTSTLFGIIQVATIKIGYVRPLKRKLIEEHS